MKARAYLLMTLVVAVWGSTFVLIKSALADASPAAFNLARMTLAFAVLLAAYWQSLRQIKPWQVAAGAVVGLCLTAGYQFQTAGLLYTTPSRSAFITGLVVVLVPLFCIVPALRPPGARMPRWNAFLGAAVALVGIVLLTTPAETGSLLPDWSAINRGDLITFGCSVGFALHCLALGRVSPRVDFRPLALLQIGFCAVFMAISLPFLGQPHLHLTPRLIGALLIAAVLATAAAFSIQSWAQSILPPSHTALLITLEPVFAWITSFIVLGERLTRRPAAGAVLILAGIALTELVPQTHPATAHEG
ncbi:DMT family transporter [Terracidiphilus gabretensis]|uniref:DMT family transporter n=1 Tax=Terracidiphilus gabretensis TaxID=1577687 RepID=UPI00071B2572|nr:DMT family transporter [Terracidiphilus gabretensis]